MKKLTYSFFTASAILFLFVSVKMYAIEDKPSTFEKKYAEVGYKSIEESIKDFQEFCKCEVSLPKVLLQLLLLMNSVNFQKTKII